MGSNNGRNCNTFELLSANRFSNKALCLTSISRESFVTQKSEKILNKENKKFNESILYNKMSETFKEKPKDYNSLIMNSKNLKNNIYPNKFELKIKNPKNKTNTNNIFIFDWMTHFFSLLI